MMASRPSAHDLAELLRAATAALDVPEPLLEPRASAVHAILADAEHQGLLDRLVVVNATVRLRMLPGRSS